MVEIGARILGLGDRTRAGIHVPDVIRNARRPCNDAPLAAIGGLGVGPPSRIIDDQGSHAALDGDPIETPEHKRAELQIMRR